MKCPECEAAGETSEVRMSQKRTYRGGSDQYWDKDGNFHNHDATTVMTPIHCSRGHTWKHIGVTPCPTCGKQVNPGAS